MFDLTFPTSEHSDDLPATAEPVVHFYAAAPVHILSAVDRMRREPLTETSAKRVARVKPTLTEHTIEALDVVRRDALTPVTRERSNT